MFDNDVAAVFFPLGPEEVRFDLLCRAPESNGFLELN
jgi:hypothetical protein